MTTEIKLTKGFVAIVDDVDADLAKFKWTSKNGKHTTYAKRAISIGPYKQKTILMHRVILERILNRPLEKGEMPDHKNGNGCDNSRSNIRLATYAQNCRNVKKRSDSKWMFKGVRASGNKWVANIRVDGTNFYLGIFKTQEEAHEAYVEAALKYHGEFARTI